MAATPRHGSDADTEPVEPRKGDGARATSQPSPNRAAAPQALDPTAAQEGRSSNNARRSANEIRPAPTPQEQRN